MRNIYLNKIRKGDRTVSEGNLNKLNVEIIKLCIYAKIMYNEYIHIKPRYH
jgi:hypothetical protein